jgi:hypothetical protein
VCTGVQSSQSEKIVSTLAGIFVDFATMCEGGASRYENPGAVKDETM